MVDYGMTKTAEIGVTRGVAEAIAGTGVTIAAYRIAVEHESVADAVSEMHRFRYDWLFLPHLER